MHMIHYLSDPFMEADHEDDDGLQQHHSQHVRLLRKQFRSLGTYPLVTLELNTTYCVIPANLLALTIRNTRDTLQQILAENVTLSGNWKELCASLTNHPNLHTVSLSYVKQDLTEEEEYEEEEKTDVSYHPDLLQALATCGKLQSLKLCVQQQSCLQNISTGTIQQLCSLPSLRTLSLSIEAPTSTWIHLLTTLHSNTTLTNLGLPSFYPSPKERTVLQAVGTLLRVNATLDTLSLSYGDPNALLPIARALKHSNRTLKHLQLYDHARNYYYREATDGALVPALVDTLQHNFVLESIDLSNLYKYSSSLNNNGVGASTNNHKVSWNAQVEFRLEMNHWYRTHYMEATTTSSATKKATTTNQQKRKILVQQILQHQNDPSVLFYVLSQHPNLLVPSDLPY